MNLHQYEEASREANPTLVASIQLTMKPSELFGKGHKALFDCVDQQIAYASSKDSQALVCHCAPLLDKSSQLNLRIRQKSSQIRLSGANLGKSVYL